MGGSGVRSKLVSRPKRPVRETYGEIGGTVTVWRTGGLEMTGRHIDRKALRLRSRRTSRCSRVVNKNKQPSLSAGKTTNRRRGQNIAAAQLFS